MLYYDVNYQNVGVSNLSYSSLSGELELNLYQDLKSAFNGNGIFPLDDYRNPSALASGYSLYFTVNPLLKIQSGLSSVPFGSTPEARYKIGSYSYIKGYEIVILEDETFQAFPYESEPVFINYERNALKPGYLIVSPGVDYQQAMQIDLTGGSSGTTPCIPRIASPYYSGSFALSYCGGISLNLNEGIIADMVISYQYSVITAENDPTYGDYFYTF